MQLPQDYGAKCLDGKTILNLMLIDNKNCFLKGLHLQFTTEKGCNLRKNFYLCLKEGIGVLDKINKKFSKNANQ